MYRSTEHPASQPLAYAGKRLGIMQPYFFPYIGYYQMAAAVERFLIYDDVNYINRGYIARNKLLINGKELEADARGGNIAPDAPACPVSPVSATVKFPPG